MTDKRESQDRRSEPRGGRRLIDFLHSETGPTLTPIEFSNMTGFKYDTIMKDIRCGVLIATPIPRGPERVRYFILWENARAWLQAMGVIDELAKIDALRKRNQPPAA